MEVENLIKNIKKLRKKSAEYNTKVFEAERTLRSICKHEHTHVNTTYFAGSYLDTGFYRYTTTCKTCGKELDVKEVSTGSYG